MADVTMRVYYIPVTGKKIKIKNKMDAFIGFKAAAKMQKKPTKNASAELQQDKTFHSLHTFIGHIVLAASSFKTKTRLLIS